MFFVTMFFLNIPAPILKNYNAHRFCSRLLKNHFLFDIYFSNFIIFNCKLVFTFNEGAIQTVFDQIMTLRCRNQKCHSICSNN